LKQEKIFIGGGMDTDSAIEYIDQRDYISAWNIRTTGTDGQEVGYVTSIEGTVQIPYSLPSGLNTAIGGRVFREFRKAYAFIYNSNQRHLVTEYDFDTNTITKVFQNIVDTGGLNILLLDPAKYVEDINIVNGILYFLPSSRIPSRIHIEDFKTGALGVVQEQDLMVIKPKPLDILTASITSDPFKAANLLENKIVKFSHQFIYKDNEESVFSEPSKATSSNTVANTGTTGTNNSMIVNIPLPDDRVKTVVIAAKINNNDQWVEIKRIDREEILSIPYSVIDLTSPVQTKEIYTNGVYSFVFYNDGLYPPIDAQLTDLEYDRVPDKAEAQELLNGNILAYMNLTEGHDTPEVDVSVSVTYVDKIAQNSQDETDPLRATGVYNQQVNIPQLRYRLHYYFKGTVKTGDKITLYTKDITTNQIINIYNYTVPVGFNNNTVGALNDFANTVGGFYSTPSVTYDAPSLTYDFSFVSFVRDIADRGQVVLANQSVSSFTSVSALKLNSNRQYGILYEYPYGKLAGVATNDKMVAPSDSFGTTHGSSPVVNLTINSTPPEGAIGYYIVSSGQLTHQKTTYMVGKISTEGATPDQVVFDVTSLLKFNEDHKSSVVNYSFTKGDRASFALYESGGLPTYFDGTATPKQDLLVTSFEASDDGAGSITYLLKVQKGSLNTATLTGKNVLIEVYTPKLQSEDDDLFYTIGERYDIINGAHSVTNIQIDRGEIYIKTRQYRNPQDYDDFNTYIVEDLNYSDFEETAVTDLGRPYLYNKNFKQQRLKAHIRYGDVFNASTGFYQLNRFKSENIYGNNSGQTTDKFGEGMKMRQRGTSLIVFAELEVGYIPVNTTIYEDVTGQANVAVSAKLLNNIRYNGQGIGIGKATKSFAENEGEYYFVDPNKSKPVKVDRGGVRFIAGKMSKFFERLLQTTTATGRDIIGYFHDFYKEYSLSIQSVNGIVVQIPLGQEDWETDDFIVTANQITVSQPTNGTVTYNNTTGKAIYTPDEGYVGADPFEFAFLSKTRNVCLSVEAGEVNPEPFDFIDKIGQELSSLIESNSIVILGTTSPSPISIISGEYSLDDGTTWASSSGVIQPYGSVRVRRLSSASYLTSTSTTLIIGSESADFIITTKSDNDTPTSFTFTPILNANTSTTYVSNIVTISGLGVGVSVDISILAGEYRINGGSWTSANEMIQDGDTLQLRNVSSILFETTSTTTVTVGTYSTDFDITTRAEDASDYFLKLEEVSTGGTGRNLIVRLTDEDDALVTVTDDISFDWGATSTPVGGGGSAGIGATDVVLPNGTNTLVVFTFDSASETLSDLVIANPDPSILGGHLIIV